MTKNRTDITTNIVFLRRDNEILLAMKKRGMGVGKWNGVGGKIDPGESVEQSAVREAKEEIEVDINQDDLKRVADIRFYGASVGYIGTRVFMVSEWSGDPAETEEMRPKWFKLSEIPYDKMWDDDKYWLPLVLDSKIVDAEFYFDQNDKVIDQKIKEV